MGTEISSQKHRTASSCDEGMTLRIRNNFQGLHFHQVHGDNVKLSKNGKVACRSEGFCKGIAFSDRPVTVCEPVCIKFVDISANWSGALRIGFTMNDPLSMKSKLPRYACPDLTSIHGNWAKAIAERMARKDSILYYYVDQNGDVHYGIDSEEHGIFFGGVNTSSKLWAVLDIYGNTVAVEFVDPNSLTQVCVNDSQSNLITVPRNTDNQNSASAFISELNVSLSFHYTHGKHILLKMDRCVASRKPGFDSLAYTFMQRPFNLGEKVAIQILQMSLTTNGNLVYGITSCNPSTLNPSELPENADDLIDRPEYWVVKNDSNFYEVGDIIVYSISPQGELTVTKNCDFKTSIFYVDPTQPLWLFFNITGPVSEVRILGSSLSDVSGIINQLENMKVSLPPKAEDGVEDSEFQLNTVPGPSGQQSFSECVICYEEPVDCALYRCGHMCMCYACATKIWKPNTNVQCPICRESIQDVIKIYR